MSSLESPLTTIGATPSLSQAEAQVFLSQCSQTYIPESMPIAATPHLSGEVVPAFMKVLARSIYARQLISCAIEGVDVNGATELQSRLSYSNRPSKF